MTQRGLFDVKPIEELEPLPVLAAPEDTKPDPERLRIMKLGSPKGSKYCFTCDRFEMEVLMYLVGKRWMFICQKVAIERGGIQWDSERNSREYEERKKSRSRNA